MLPLLRHCFTRRIFNTLAFELLALNLCFSILFSTQTPHWLQANNYALLTALFSVAATTVVQFSLWSFGLYSREIVYSGNRIFSNLLGSLVFSAVLLFPVCYVFSQSGVNLFSFTFRFYTFGLVGFTSVIAMERLLVLKFFNDTPYLGNILILGTGPATDEVVAAARRQHGKTFRLVGLLSESAEETGQAVGGCRVLGTIEDIARVVRDRKIRGILISLPIYSPLLPTEFLLKCKLNGIPVWDSSEFYETLAKKVLLEKMDPVQFLLSDYLLMTRFRWAVKVVSEKLLAVVILLITSPLLVLTALLIKLQSAGPVLYRQDRVGKDGKVFKLLKFRSMVVGAEPDGLAVWATKNDSRVTPLGKVMRKFRIDELPQLFNVLGGEMGFVGPRPERPEFVKRLQKEIPYYDERHLVLPGITGWAQVVYPYGSSVEDAREKLRYDLYYIKNMSFLFDMMIALSTVRTVLFGRGGR